MIIFIGFILVAVIFYKIGVGVNTFITDIAKEVVIVAQKDKIEEQEKEITKLKKQVDKLIK